MQVTVSQNLVCVLEEGQQNRRLEVDARDMRRYRGDEQGPQKVENSISTRQPHILTLENRIWRVERK